MTGGIPVISDGVLVPAEHLDVPGEACRRGTHAASRRHAQRVTAPRTPRHGATHNASRRHARRVTAPRTTRHGATHNTSRHLQRHGADTGISTPWRQGWPAATDAPWRRHWYLHRVNAIRLSASRRVHWVYARLSALRRHAHRVTAPRTTRRGTYSVTATTLVSRHRGGRGGLPQRTRHGADTGIYTG